MRVLDRRLRAGFDRPLRVVAARLARLGVRADTVTSIGFTFGVAACVAIAFDARWVALVLWLANRVADGLDGVLARGVGASDRGGFIDLVADFTVYAGFVVGIAIARPDARVAAIVLLGAYYVSGAAFLAWSTFAERRARAIADDRSLHFVGGVAEGAETVVVYVLLCVWPSATEVILWTFVAAVGVTALQRVRFGWRALSDHDGAADRGPGRRGSPSG